MKYWMYEETAAHPKGQPPAILFDYKEVAAPPVGFATAATAQGFMDAEQLSLFDISDYRRWRLAAKNYIVNTLGGGSEEAGFNALPDAEAKKFFAKHNIGTGLQRLAAIPSDIERDTACFDFLVKSEGVSWGNDGYAIKNKGGVWLKALVFSRLDHVFVPAYQSSIPAVMFMMLQITASSVIEISGNLLEMYKTQGIDGLALGGPPLGISDFAFETPTTRFDPANGGGLKTNALIVSSVTDSITATGIGVSGYTGTAEEQLALFSNELLYIIQTGKPTYL